ncbi:MAG: hypothetical protein A3D24_03605 [Candidatus Blackburnbacteria bacterium RIFCSPHIGHO2_02_FULL_39_13]|uniref:PIN domain-containing protein n=1 Tax=Candidatus Blackburnbacteria bacterium RIFCSPLOWO2_01_FULL_40_20 TaxID=1797519 RepID=A0A1G1VEI2_9BACT|nr:MAG: hypothetical protein UT38_C0018G0009 [Microgenomates group bacterium GW2011_GWA2_39_19]OGY07158.1 MAG: hypothetical protein A2694_01205 [Candidatus Blackburnbacteria bacterium RIFCSPHIGHO2_01_FULL_40_17]OGY09988.1 MAG: hypothetical protein A3D24_03605 [Candidatus Blackburnbacteria bacterium RIFCSPHIGHO2_02_FULL_39_13]OGY13834.1 MAG: hypothetical protein A3A77_03595 [Candidatus Blackburnbacteria bacterium RIFCSPLOWO2_01_FULL_40_20]
MKKVFIETSVFIRLFTQDDSRKFGESKILFDKINSGDIRPYVSGVVIQEILYILTRLYKFPKLGVIADLQKILQLRNVVLIEKTDTEKALLLFKRHAIKYGDCLISTQVPKSVVLISYDSDFGKIKGLKVSTLSDVISK